MPISSATNTPEFYEAGTRMSSGGYTDPHNDLTHQWMMEANAFNAAEAQKNRDFQERMSNTAYQRMAKDLLAANINPILAGQLGGASTPGGSAAQANFTGAGATSSNWAQSTSMSVQDALYNTAMNGINEATKMHYGQTVNQLASSGANWLLDQMKPVLQAMGISADYSNTNSASGTVYNKSGNGWMNNSNSVETVSNKMAESIGGKKPWYTHTKPKHEKGYFGKAYYRKYGSAENRYKNKGEYKIK